MIERPFVWHALKVDLSAELALVVVGPGDPERDVLADIVGLLLRPLAKVSWVSAILCDLVHRLNDIELEMLLKTFGPSKNDALSWPHLWKPEDVVVGLPRRLLWWT